ncbi:hypothetical protein ACIRF8_10770 [Streptomyces sp. NPDC102406]|uniref:hypothetical protein n=1 Tax=Streptomyces sp. NPDC102406 TaxID=3366171 RepID=UPI00383077E1
MTLVVAAVLALSLFTSVRAFAPAHEYDRTPVSASGEHVPTAAPAGHPYPQDPAEALRTRDRHRAGAGGLHLPTPAPPTPALRPPAFPPPAVTADVCGRPGRAVPDRTAATLQVFRC